MTDQLYGTHTYFVVPEDAGGGRYLVGLTRQLGGFGGHIDLIEQASSPSARKLRAAWLNSSTQPIGDEKLIRMAIGQALSENRFSAVLPESHVQGFVLRMATVPYDGEALEFSE